MAAFVPIAGQLTKQFGGNVFNLFRLGHADDAVDQAEDQWLQNFVIPVVSKALGGKSVPFSWVETDRAISAIDAAKTPLSANEAVSIIADGDQRAQQLCASFAQQGFPCGGKPGYAGGAGKDIPRTWSLLRSKLTEIRNAKSGVSSLLGGAGAGGGFISRLLGGGSSADGTVQSGFLQGNVVLIGAALIAAWIIALQLRERE